MEPLIIYKDIELANRIRKDIHEKENETMSRGGIIVGASHKDGGINFPISSDESREFEGAEIVIPREFVESDSEYRFQGKNQQILASILDLCGLSLNDRVGIIKTDDIIVCVRSAWNSKIRIIQGTIKQILSAINESCGCRRFKDGALVKEIEENPTPKLST